MSGKRSGRNEGRGPSQPSSEMEVANAFTASKQCQSKKRKRKGTMRHFIWNTGYHMCVMRATHMRTAGRATHHFRRQ